MKKESLKPFHVQPSTPAKVLGLSSQWYEWVSRETCISRDETWIRGFIKQGVKAIASVPDRRANAYVVDEPSFLGSLRRRERAMLKGWQRHIAPYEPRRQNIRKSVSVLLRSLNGDRAEIRRRFRAVVRAADDWTEYINGAWAVIFLVEPALARAFPDKLETIFALERPIKFMELQRDLFRKPMRELVRNYWWLNVYNSFDKPYTIERLKKLKAETNRAEVERVFRNFPPARRRFKAFLKTVRDPLLRRRAEMAHTYAYLKTDRVDVWRWLFANLVPFYRWLAREMRVSFRQVLECYLEEVFLFLERGERPAQRDLADRVAGRWLTVYHRRTAFTVRGTRPVADVLEGMTSNQEGAGLVRGTPASPGQGQGRARIIHTPADLRQVRQGDVFIARFTYPQYTPVMRRCSAIVTDDGGMTSHAAVVAREFRIPCVVGTGQATRVFHDGDRVEVDATKGIVRKLK